MRRDFQSAKITGYTVINDHTKENNLFLKHQLLNYLSIPFHICPLLCQVVREIKFKMNVSRISLIRYGTFGIVSTRLCTPFELFFVFCYDLVHTYTITVHVYVFCGQFHATVGFFMLSLFTSSCVYDLDLDNMF